MAKHEFGILELTAYLTGDCSRQKAVQFEGHVETCAQCRAAIEKLREEKKSFLAAHPFETVFNNDGQGKEMSPVKAAPFIRAPWYGIAACLVVLLAGGLYVAQRYQGPTYTLKGKTGIIIVAKNAEDKPEVRRSQQYRPGENIQMLYSCGEENRFMLFAVDDSGRTTTYYPDRGDSSVTLDKGAAAPLPQSIILDEYVGRELYVAIFTKEKIAVADAKAAIDDAWRRRPDLSSLDIRIAGGAVVRQVLTTKTDKD